MSIFEDTMTVGMLRDRLADFDEDLPVLLDDDCELRRIGEAERALVLEDPYMGIQRAPKSQAIEAVILCPEEA